MLGILALLVFISEVALWLGAGRLAYIFFPDSKILAYGAAFVAVALIIFLWGIIFSPRAKYRLSKIPRILAIVVLCIAVGYGLYAKGDQIYGLILMVGATVIQVLGQSLVHQE